MSLKSMTGFSSTVYSTESCSFKIEARSVNGRGLDIKTKQPSGYEAFERLAKEIGKSYLSRGQVNLVLTVDGNASTNSISINREVLEMYLKLTQELTDSGMTLTPTADGLLGLKGVIETETSLESALDADLISELEAALRLSFADLVRAREIEGRALSETHTQHMATLTSLVSSAESLSFEQSAVIKERLQKKIEELSIDLNSIEDRLIQEVTFAAIKADIKEELDRLSAHIAQAISLINEDKNQGRKLDFLAQEFMREANTLCSKSASINLTQVGLELKIIIDQFREQCQNVE